MHMCYNFLHHLGTGYCLPKTMFRNKIGGGGAWLGEHPNILYPQRISATVEANNFKFGRRLGFGTSLPKNNVLDQNRRGSGLGEHPKKIGTSYLFLQTLKLATSNLVHKLGLGLAYQKTTVWTKIGGSGPVVNCVVNLKIS